VVFHFYPYGSRVKRKRSAVLEMDESNIKKVSIVVLCTHLVAQHARAY